MTALGGVASATCQRLFIPFVLSVPLVPPVGPRPPTSAPPLASGCWTPRRPVAFPPAFSPSSPFPASASSTPDDITGTDHVYLATWATLLAVRHHNRTAERKIETLVCPAFGAGTGGVAGIEVGFQMKLAWEHFRKVPSVITPSFAQERHERIYYGGRMGFEKPINRIQ